MPLVDLDFLRGLYDAHNRAGTDFPDLLARDYLHPDVEFVELATARGAATHQDPTQPPPSFEAASRRGRCGSRS
jgi:hypothetical protein